MLSQQVETKSRLLAKLLRELLQRDDYGSLADLTDALKQRCASLRIRYTAEDVLSAFQLVGSNRALVDTPLQAVDLPSGKPDARPFTPMEATRLHRELMRRYQAGQPVVERAVIVPEVDQEWVRRLSALTEELALDGFWETKPDIGRRLPVLLLFSAVTLTRPDDWDKGAIRRAHDDGSAYRWVRVDVRQCHGCFTGARDLSRHHVIAIDHGGSNAVRNIVAICALCHAYLHPWLTDQPRRQVSGFGTFGQFIAQSGRLS